MEELLTVEQLAKELNVTTRTIRNYLKDGKLSGTKVGGQWRFSKNDIYQFLDVEAMPLERQYLLNYLDTEVKANHSILSLTLSIEQVENIDGVRDYILDQYNSTYSRKENTFHYQYLQNKIIRITLIGTNHYVLNFGNWIENLVERVNLSV